jgi:hypothetical protein
MWRFLWHSKGSPRTQVDGPLQGPPCLGVGRQSRLCEGRLCLAEMALHGHKSFAEFCRFFGAHARFAAVVVLSPGMQVRLHGITCVRVH